MNKARSRAETLKKHGPATRVMRKAVREALLRHKKLGFPVVVEKNGKVVWIAPEDIPE